MTKPTVDDLDKRVASLEYTRWLDRILLRFICAPIIVALATKALWAWLTSP